MAEKLKAIGAAILMGLAWAAAWAPVAVLIGLMVDPDGSMDEIWPAIGAYPGFLSAVIFCALIRITERRGLAELPLVRAGGWGAVAGVLVGALPFTIGESTSQLPVWLLAAVVIGCITLLSAASAIGTVLLRRSASRKHHYARAA